MEQWQAELNRITKKNSGKGMDQRQLKADWK